MKASSPQAREANKLLWPRSMQAAAACLATQRPLLQQQASLSENRNNCGVSYSDVAAALYFISLYPLALWRVVFFHLIHFIVIIAAHNFPKTLRLQYQLICAFMYILYARIYVYG